MAGSLPDETALLNLPLEVLADVCQELDLRDLVRVAATCKRFRHGDSGLETVELPTKSPVVTVLRDRAFPDGVLTPNTRPTGCSESWVAYLARCARQRRCREAPPIETGPWHSVLVDAAGRLLTYGRDCGASRAAIAGVRMRSVAAGLHHSLALGCNGRVYSWGRSAFGALGHGDKRDRLSPVLVEALEGVRSIAASKCFSLAVTQSGIVFHWGESFLPQPVLPQPIMFQPFLPGEESEDSDPGEESEDSDEEDLGGAEPPTIVDGFGEVRVRRVFAGDDKAFAIGEDGEVFSWGRGCYGNLGHGDKQDQRSPKRVEALRGVRVTSVSFGGSHALALAEGGLVYAWGENWDRALLGDPNVERELLPKPVEALRGVRVGGVAAANNRGYALAGTGEVWAWGRVGDKFAPLGHGEKIDCPLPKPIESLRGIKMDAVAAGYRHTLAVADNGSLYVWGDSAGAGSVALCLGTSAFEDVCVPTPQRVPDVRLACGL
jgi:hypothetical protein